ncbi:hypothetical protein PYJP_14250 [Pyrofollis japonicus]|uniref:prefoldin subunit alpha n=1 Tax=Pyrofollis japonicus TaxID=3060460 RepID=UPI00295BB676|nr:prefoldin subunit alpha [Pyrofollis japonicus]BEP18073.1 hypothetical protein PYJP_14250 [Pyrofollis japonicus]
MSKEQAITLEEAIAQLTLLENQIKQLQELVADLSARITRLSTVEEALLNLEKGSDDAFIPLDVTGTVFVRGTIMPIDRVLLHAGLDVFIEVGRDKALEVIREEKSSTSKLLDGYNRELAQLTQYYAALRSAVEQALQQARQQGQQ